MNRTKAEFLRYLATVKKVQMAATECSVAGGVADILALGSNGYVEEFELKTGWIDAIHGEKAKMEKHALYAEVHIQKTRIPNYFSLVIPIEILEKVEPRIGELHNNYGIIVYDKDYHFTIHKGAYLLHSGNATKLRKEIMRRMVADWVELMTGEWEEKPDKSVPVPKMKEIETVL